MTSTSMSPARAQDEAIFESPGGCKIHRIPMQATIDLHAPGRLRRSPAINSGNKPDANVLRPTERVTSATHRGMGSMMDRSFWRSRPDVSTCRDQVVDCLVTGFNYPRSKRETISVCSRKLLKRSSPRLRPFIQQSNAAPFDLQSWTLVVRLVSRIFSECSTIPTAFALQRRDDNGTETSTRLAKKGKARSRQSAAIAWSQREKC